MACQPDTQLNYEDEIIVGYLTDMALMDAVVDYYPPSAKDSVSNILKSNIINRHQLDSLKINEDVDRITSDPALTEIYFSQVKDQLDSLRSL